MTAYVVDGALLGGAHPVLDLGEGLLDRIEVGRVWRQIPEPCAGGFDQGAEGGRFVAAEIIHDDDIAGQQLWDENLLDIGAEAFAIDRPVEQTRCGEAIAAQGAEESQCLPVAMRGEATHPLALLSPSAQWGHVGLDPSLVDEDQAVGIEVGLP